MLSYNINAFQFKYIPRFYLPIINMISLKISMLLTKYNIIDLILYLFQIVTMIWLAISEVIFNILNVEI